MHIILWLAAVSSPASSAPPVQLGTGAMTSRGQVHVAPARGPNWRVPPDNWGRPGDRRRRHHRGGLGRGGDRFPYPYAFTGYSELPDPYGGGFFSAGGGEISWRGGRPYYDYDRSYPYEWARSVRTFAGRAVDEEDLGPTVPLCRIERGVRVCRGGR